MKQNLEALAAGLAALKEQAESLVEMISELEAETAALMVLISAMPRTIGGAVRQAHHGCAADEERMIRTGGGENGQRKKVSQQKWYPTQAMLYRYADRPDASKRLMRLYQYMSREYKEDCSFIDPETDPSRFCALFEGKETDAVVVWTESKQKLVYFVNRLIERGLVRLPKGLTKWIFVQNHFADWRKRVFTDLNKQHRPQRSVIAIEKLLDLLDPAVTSGEDLGSV